MLTKIILMLTSLLFYGCVAPTEVQAEPTIKVAYFAREANVQHFPVGKAVEDWNKNPVGIRLVRVVECTPSYVPCVSISEKQVQSFFRSGGWFYRSIDVKWGHSHSFIDLAYWQGFAYGERQEIICHELGHYLQVPHGKHCMNSYLRKDRWVIDADPHPGQVNLNLVKFPFVL
jgi:hypothetical protein